MAESAWPTLSIGIPEDVSDHAACLRNDFEEVHRSLQASHGTNIPRYLFDILHRSYSRLCAKLQIEGDDGGSQNSTFSANEKFEEQHIGSPEVAITASEKHDTGVPQVRSNNTSDRDRDKQTDRQRDLEELQPAERTVTDSEEVTNERSDQYRRQSSEGSSSCIILRAQDLESDFGQATGHRCREEALRKAMVDDMHESKFSVTLAVDPNVVTSRQDREYLLRHLENLPAIDRSLKIYAAINKDPAIANASSLLICHSNMTRKRKLQISVRCSQDRSQLLAARDWITHLICELIRDIRNENPSVFSGLERGEYHSPLLKHTDIQLCPKTKDSSRPVLCLDLNKLSFVVQTPFKYSKTRHKQKKPRKILATVRNVINEDPALDMNWVTAARLTETDDVWLLVNDKEALNTLLIDKGWKIRLRSQLGKGQESCKVLMKDVPVSSILSMDLSIKKKRSMAARHLELCNSGPFRANVIQTVIFAPQFPNEDVGKLSIIIDFNKPEPANQALTQGLLWDGVRHDCVRWLEGDLFEQCYKFQALEYHEMECRGELRCGKCAGSHSTILCDQAFSECVLCGGAHESTDSSCPIRFHHEAKAKLAVPPKLLFKSVDSIEEPTEAMAINTHKHQAQPLPPKNPRRDLKKMLKKMAVSRAGEVNHESALSDWFGGIEMPDNATQPTAPKRKAAEPLESTAGNIQSNASAKRVKREEVEEDHIQQYIRENGAIPWPPPREERIVDNVEALSRRQRPRKSNITYEPLFFD